MIKEVVYKKNVLFITNIPVPYRIDFFNELGKFVNLTVVFEAKSANNQGIKFNWNLDKISNFKAVFLSNGDINEKKIDWRILKYINKNKYDIIVATSYSYLTEMIALLYLKLKKIPYFLETDGGLIRNETMLKRKYKTFLISGAQGYFSPSDSSDKYLNYYGANIEKIYRYSFSSLRNEDIMQRPISKVDKLKIREKLNVNADFVILSVGQFIHRKGYDIFLKACRALNENIQVIIIGGEVTSEYLQLIKKYNLSNIRFENFKSKELLSQYYLAADLFVLPTREDVWGLVINEAMAHGLPIITTEKCGAGLELINNGENGYLFTSENDKELAEILVSASKNKLKLEEMGQNNLKKIRQYTVEHMAYQHYLIFRENLKVSI